MPDDLPRSAIWPALDRLVDGSAIVIDRPRNSCHPVLVDHVYPIDYGYLEGTRAGDGEGIDVWIGASGDRRVVGIMCVLDPNQRELEVKLFVGCTRAEIELAGDFMNGVGLPQLLVLRESSND